MSGLDKFIIGKLAYRIFWCPGPTGVGFGVPFFVSGLHKFMGKLADGIFWGPGSIWACCAVQWSLCLSFKNCIGKLADRIFFGVQGLIGGWVWGSVLCICPL